MKVLIVSDSHGLYAELAEVVRQQGQHVDAIIHCGDSELPFDDPLWEQVTSAVAGNMDFDRSFGLEDVVDIQGIRLFVVHGHLVCVNRQLVSLAEEAKSRQCTIACYGHTHRLNAEMIHGVLCINPGSLRSSRGPVHEPTYAILEWNESTATVRWYTPTHQLLPALTKQFTLGATS